MKSEDVINCTIFEFIRGSNAYGTNTPESDEDIGGVFIPSKEIILGVKHADVFDNWKDSNGNKIDKSMYNLNKAFDLFIDNNPNMLDFLYAPERCIKIATKEWERIADIRDEFLCTKAKFTFQGYAYAQMKRLESHRTFLRHLVTKPNRVDFGLPEQSMFPETQVEVIARLASEYVNSEDRDEFMNEITSVMHSEGALTFKKYISPELYPIAITDFKRGLHNFLRMISSLSGCFLKDEYVDMANKELQFLAKQKEYDAYCEWKKNRNHKRAEIEGKTGFDCKHACHLIRLAQMSTEILEGKGVLVDRTNIDREYLLDIRNGKYSFEQILEHSKQLSLKSDELYKTTTLKKKPNIELINSLRMQLLEEQLFKERKNEI